jgi:cyclophilin family peptidyl-prolyl cis-trans isomerase
MRSGLPASVSRKSRPLLPGWDERAARLLLMLLRVYRRAAAAALAIVLILCVALVQRAGSRAGGSSATADRSSVTPSASLSAAATTLPAPAAATAATTPSSSPLVLPPPPPPPPPLPPPPSQWPIVHCETTKGDATLRVRPDWSPLGAARFLDLVRAGYFSNNLFYRVPPIRANPIFQFGLQPNKELSQRPDLTSKIKDDPPVRCDGGGSDLRCHAEPGLARTTGLRRGMVGFGGGGHSGESRTSHLWILRRDSKHLGKASWETPVAEVRHRTIH